MNEEQLALLRKVRKAVEYADNGDPIKDAIDECDIMDVLRLLVFVVDGV